MEEKKKCMFNTESSNVAGYCKLHDAYMTVKQIRCKQCLQKQCWHLERNYEHKWWAQRAEKKQLRIERKQRLANM
jgi:hypothetical protein